MLWRFIPLNTYPAAKNMALDELLLDEVIHGTSPNTLRFYKWSPSAASIGAHQSLSTEIDTEAAKKMHVDVVRRISGGGAVFHDAIGEITYAVICHLKDLPRYESTLRVYDPSIPKRFHAILEALAFGLEQIGIKIDIGKIHCPALLVGGKKISGNAQLIRNNVLLQHGTILLHVQPEVMYKILKAPEGVSNTKMIQSVRAKVKGICDDEGNDQGKRKEQKTKPSEFLIVDALTRGFSEIFKIQFQTQPLSQEEEQRIEKLAKEFYQNPDWLNKFP